MPRQQKIRADQRLVDLGMVESRARGQSLILADRVTCGDRRIVKPGEQIAGDAVLTVSSPDHPWVSRGGLKLAHGLAAFGLDPTGRVALDIGASTGGFTDVLLTHGASRVHAVDVGHGQLAWRLRTDPRVIVHERLNARYLTAEQVGETPSVLVCDASFIGLRTLLPACLAVCRPGAWAIALIKPQFEAGAAHVGHKGVVRDPIVHTSVCDEISRWWSNQAGWSVLGILPSPITGPEGNREFLIGAALEG